MARETCIPRDCLEAPLRRAALFSTSQRNYNGEGLRYHCYLALKNWAVAKVTAPLAKVLGQIL